jgi:CRISPR-associated protein Cas2
MVVVVCYDVRNNRRRLRLYRLLEGFGRPVQRSVFECDLRPAELGRLQARVGRIVSGDEDLVRYYVLCESCVGRIAGVGGEPVARAPAYYLV